jgi:hypothetical protein
MAVGAQQDPGILAEGAMHIEAAVKWSGLSRSKLYQAMALGNLQYVKDGKRRLIPKRGLRDYLADRLEGGIS